MVPRRPFPWPRATAPALVLALALVPTGPTLAQGVQGTVLDALSGAPVHTADVALLADGDRIVGRTTTGRDGWFYLPAPGAGTYRVRAERFGYAPLTTDPFPIEAGRDAVSELRLRPDPVPVAGVAATVPGRSPRLERVGFYRRRELRFGYFLGPEDIRKRRPVFMDDLFWGIPGGRRFGRCTSTVVVDGFVLEPGMPSWTTLLYVNDVEALEVYPGFGGVPVWAQRNNLCGAILIWTKGSR